MPRRKQLTSDEKIAEIVRLMQSDDSVDAPEDAIVWARNLARGRVAAAEPGPLRRLLAVLTVDLAAGKPAFGERSASTSSTRQILFEAEDHAIDIRITPSGKSFFVHGQILTDDPVNALVRIKGVQETAVKTDEFGDFRFEELGAGTYELSVMIGELEITTPPFTLS